MRLIGIGEILWDLFGNAEHLGGAVLNFSVHAARLGHDVALISAVGEDDRGRRALQRARELGLSTRFIQSIAGQATGIVTVTVDAGGQPSYVIHRPAAYDFATPDEADLAELGSPAPHWICYGTLLSMAPDARAMLERVLARFPEARRFYDVNLRVNSYTPALVRELLDTADLVKLNDHEVQAVQEMCGTAHQSLEAFCRDYAARLRWDGVCVTRGELGCALLLHGEYAEVAGYPVQVADTVGAGDAFSAALLHAVGNGWSARESGDFANRVGALVASRPGGVPDWSMEEVLAQS